MVGGAELGIGYRIGASGADDTLQKLKALHEEVRQGSLTSKEYTKQHRELTLAGRASSQQFNDMKGAIMSANPNLMEFNKTMSIFSGTANTAMSALNTINLSLLSGSQAAQTMSAQFQKNADDYNNFIRLYNSPQYGPGSPVTEAAYEKYQADLNSTSNLQNQLGVASLNTALSVSLAAVSMVGSMSQTYTALKAIQWGNVFAAISAGASTALGAVTTFATAVLLPLALVVAGFYGAYALIRALNPQYAASMDELTGIIEKNWNVSQIEATLLAPFVGAALGFANLEDQMTEGFYDFVNSVINAINTIPTAINGLISSIPGLKSALGGLNIGTISNVLPPGFANGGQNSNYNQMLQALNINQNGSNSNGTGINANTPYSQYTSTNPLSVPSADQTGTPTVAQIQQSLQDLQQPTGQTASNTTNSLSALVGIGSGISQMNQLQASINSGITNISSATAALAQPLITQANAQAQVGSALQAGFTSLQQQLVANQAALTQANANLQAVSAPHEDQLQNDPNMTASDFPDIIAAMKGVSDAQAQITATQNAIAQNQTQQTILDNTTSGLAPVLNSIGFSSSTGIGSVIAGALGDYAGLGGAGMNASQMAAFAATGDYGQFTAAANGDFAAASGTPSSSTQAQDWLQSLGIQPGGTGGTYTAAQMQEALSAIGANAGGTAGQGGSGAGGGDNYDPNGGTFGGLPGQYGNPLGTPVGSSGSGGTGGINVTVNNNVQGSILSSQDLTDQMTQSVMNGLLGVGWG